MKKVIVIGGGLAGLTSAAYLAKSGFKVEVLEASKKIGGRAYSFVDTETNTLIDNGQHILMGCYKETLKFLNLIGSTDKIIIQKNLNVNFLKENFQQFPLKANSFPYPLNLLTGLLNYKAISISNRFKLLKFFLKIPFYSDNELKKMSVAEWLEKENQDEEIKKAFWEILAISAMNTNLQKASAKIFSTVLKEIFFKGNKAAAIIIPSEGLSEIYCNDSKKYIEEMNGKINFSESVECFTLKDDNIVEIKTSKRIIKDFDYVVSALPLSALSKISDLDFISKIPEIKYSSILSVHIWLKGNALEKTFYGLINSPVHWIFNHGSHLTLVISDADYLAEKTKEEIIEICKAELKKYLNLDADSIRHFKVIKEKRATFIPSNEIEGKRPATVTGLKNLFLAGDWTDTGLPSTIESAVKSGRTAAHLIERNS